MTELYKYYLSSSDKLATYGYNTKREAIKARDNLNRDSSKFYKCPRTGEWESTDIESPAHVMTASEWVELCYMNETDPFDLPDQADAGYWL